LAVGYLIRNGYQNGLNKHKNQIEGNITNG